MSDHATQRRVINATPQQCFEVVTDFERYPEWASDVKSATITEHDELGRGGDVQFRAAAMGRSTTYTLRYYYGSIIIPKGISCASTHCGRSELNIAATPQFIVFSDGG